MRIKVAQQQVTYSGLTEAEISRVKSYFAEHERSFPFNGELPSDTLGYRYKDCAVEVVDSKDSREVTFFGFPTFLVERADEAGLPTEGLLERLRKESHRRNHRGFVGGEE